MRDLIDDIRVCASREYEMEQVDVPDLFFRRCCFYIIG